MNDEAVVIPDLASLVSGAPAESIVSRSVFSDEHLKASIFAFAPGQELSEHTASWPAILHILQGEAQLTLGKKTVHGRAGTWAYMPAHLPHSVLAETHLLMLLVLLKNES